MFERITKRYRNKGIDTESDVIEIPNDLDEEMREHIREVNPRFGIVDPDYPLRPDEEDDIAAVAAKYRKKEEA